MRYILVYACLIAASVNPVRADDLAGPYKGYIEAGTGYDALTSGYQDRQAVFVRGAYVPDRTHRYTGEINEISQFGSTGPLFVAGYENDFSPEWILMLGGAFSPGSKGYTLPRSLVDASIGKKWLEAKNLVTTIGLT
ncbi:MAG TPA: YaiO family outer membrane beta-barrel protein, partial [Burkholderiales bacterium]|nr:YaiO family outer membrane beta-barrel protein [Burkholderiales bacterium]